MHGTWQLSRRAFGATWRSIPKPPAFVCDSGRTCSLPFIGRLAGIADELWCTNSISSWGPLGRGRRWFTKLSAASAKARWCGVGSSRTPRRNPGPRGTHLVDLLNERGQFHCVSSCGMHAPMCSDEDVEEYRHPGRLGDAVRPGWWRALRATPYQKKPYLT